LPNNLSSQKFRFSLLKTDGKARAGVISTPHGDIHTPVFMPVGTQGAVKALEQREIEEARAELLLSNTYHLYLRPGMDVIIEAGGLHRFASWNRAILTDSGGYQVFSLSDLRTVNENGVTFRSHLDGSLHEFTPERVVEIQRAIGSDILMQLDECVGYPAAYELLQSAVRRTIEWADRSLDAFNVTEPLYGNEQALFGIIQGGTHHDLRESCAQELSNRPFNGYAIGGLAVGEPAEEMYHTAEFTAGILPEDKPRYLMGVGTPENLLTAIGLGVDMFDCVIPTRNARNGMLFTSNGTVNIRNAQYRTSLVPIDAECGCYTCRTFSKSYLRHLFNAREILGLQLATIHNITYYLNLMRSAREAILEEKYTEWSSRVLQGLKTVTIQ
jgi:queuine tRNA-ribosyltransferase